MVEEQGLIGAFYVPAEPKLFPAVLLLGGSDGGMREDAAALLASHGYAVLALAYFGMEDIPKHLIRIPLEYGQTAIHWLQDHPMASAHQVSVIGISRGAELALLLASKFQEVAMASNPVENSKGPLLLLSGEDDQLWPSALFSNWILERLSKHHHPYQSSHICYPQAGHFLGFPYSLPYLPPRIKLSFGGGFEMSFGGTTKANAKATIDSWTQILRFLETTVTTSEQ